MRSYNVQCCKLEFLECCFLWDIVRVESIFNFVEFDLADWKMLLVVPMRL